MIREIRRSDGPRVAELRLIGFPEEETMLGADPEVIERIFRRLYRWDTQLLLRLARWAGRPAYRFFAAEEDAHVVAMALLSFPERAGYVSEVVVDPAYRRRGLAQALVERAREVTRATGRRYLALDVLHRNDAARALYDRLGFRPLYSASHLVRDPEAPAVGGTSPSIRPFRDEDAGPLVEVARRSVAPEVQEVVPIREGALRGSAMVSKILESTTAAWVVDHGRGAEAYVATTVSPATRAANCTNPIVGEDVPVTDADALVRTAVDWCAAHGSPRILTRVPDSNTRGRAALLGGGFHEAFGDWTLYRPVP